MSKMSARPLRLHIYFKEKFFLSPCFAALLGFPTVTHLSKKHIPLHNAVQSTQGWALHSKAIYRSLITLAAFDEPSYLVFFDRVLEYM